MIGAVAKCCHGRIGVICSLDIHNEIPRKIYYTGIGFDGKNWQSVDPEILAENINDYLDKFIYKPEEVLT